MGLFSFLYGKEQKPKVINSEANGRPNIASRPQGSVKGEIGLYGLESWWLNDFTEIERQHIQDVFKPVGSTSEPFTSINLTSSSQSAVGFLSCLAGWFSKSEDRHIAYKILLKAQAMVNADTEVLDAHFLYQTLIEIYYKDRESSEALEGAIKACQQQISIAQEAAKAFRLEYRGPLPAHKGFEQLAIILHKQQHFDEAIQLCGQAKNMGWAGDWDSHIQRYQKKQVQKL